MSGLIEIMDEMKSILDDVVGPEIQVVRGLNLNPTGVSIDIYPGDPFRESETAAFGDRGEIIFTVRARTDLPDVDGSQEALLALMDDEHAMSVAMALQDDQSLNGLASSVKVDGPSGVGFDAGAQGQTLLGCMFRVTVLNWST